MAMIAACVRSAVPSFSNDGTDIIAYLTENEMQTFGNGAIVQAFANQAQDITFAFGEIGEDGNILVFDPVRSYLLLHDPQLIQASSTEEPRF